MLCAAESSSFIVNANTAASCGSVIVATAIHQALTNLPASNTQLPPLTNALNAAADLHRVAQVSNIFFKMNILILYDKAKST